MHRSTARQLLPVLLLSLGALFCSVRPSDFVNDADERETAAYAQATLDAIHQATLGPALATEQRLTAAAAVTAAATASPTPTTAAEQVLAGTGVRTRFYTVSGTEGQDQVVACSTPVEIELTLHGDGSAMVRSLGLDTFDPYNNCAVLDETFEVSYIAYGTWEAESVLILYSDEAHTVAAEGSLDITAATLAGTYSTFFNDGSPQSIVVVGP